MFSKVIYLLLSFSVLVILTACNTSAPLPTSTPPTLADELIFYDWSGDKIDTVFDAFTREYGVKITYVSFESTEEAVANIAAGQVYDVAIIENQFIPSLIDQDLLAEIDFRNVPNFKNISANFRNLAYDPKNKHTIPYTWGTTGLVVRSDLADEPITRWADMWNPHYAGKVANWAVTPRYTLGAALRSLGYSVNSEDPAELEQALDRLRELKPNSIWVTDEAHSTAPLLVSGEAVMALGWSEDVWLAQAENENIVYVLPEEGTILWGDNFVIPANSPNKYTAELFLNFLLRPEISAQITNNNLYATPNEAARPFIDTDILNDPVVFPTEADLKNAEVLLPLSAHGEKLFYEAWERFKTAGP